jgi:hypothetical protein
MSDNRNTGEESSVSSDHAKIEETKGPIPLKNYPVDAKPSEKFVRFMSGHGLYSDLFRETNK